MRRSVSLFLSMVFVALVVLLSTPVAFGAHYTGSCGNSVSWELNSFNGEMVISGSGKMQDYTMSTAPGWNPYQQYIKSVTIGEGVQYIGDYSFYNNSGYKYRNLTSLTISSTVTEIGDYAFRGCAYLSAVSGGSAVKIIGSYAFRSCSSLVSYPFANSLTNILNGAFSLCTSLSTLDLPATLGRIGASAFNGCRSLTSILLPTSLSGIGANAFADCTSLTDVEYPIPRELTGCLGIFNGSGAPTGMNVVFSGGVQIVPADLFSNCKNLKSVTFGSNVTSIRSKAFAHTGLESVFIPEKLITIDSTAFCGCQSLTSFSVDSANTFFSEGDNGELMSINKQKLYNYPCGKTEQSYAVPDGVVDIAPGAFRENKHLKTVTIPSTVATIGQFSFADATALESITLPQNVKRVYARAFASCVNLEQLNMSGVISLGEYAFQNCNSLVTVTIPDSMTVISTFAFSNCDNLTQVTLGSGLTSIGASAFVNCPSLRSVKIPANVTSIGDYAFGYESSTSSEYSAIPITIYYYSGTVGETYAKSNTRFTAQISPDSNEYVELEEDNNNKIEIKDIIVDFFALIKTIINTIIAFIF